MQLGFQATRDQVTEMMAVIRDVWIAKEVPNVKGKWLLNDTVAVLNCSVSDEDVELGSPCTCGIIRISSRRFFPPYCVCVVNKSRLCQQETQD